MSKGFSFESFAALVNVHKDTLYEWTKAHEEFLESKKMATDLSRLWWETQAINGLFSSKELSINPTIWRLNMINRFSWKDKAEEDKKVDLNWGKLSDEELETVVKDYAKQIEEKKKK